MLAKKFIEYFISVKDEGTSRRRLRKRQELRDALCHILAITFTNKATNEMKLRIVSKLDALGSWTSGSPVKSVDYLSDFVEQFGCSPEDLASTCRHALRVLLSDYGDFKVSTIDSFFQTVLRTFAFEADLDDTYQIELDSSYVAQMGLDTTLDAIESSDVDTDGLSWVNDMMEKKASSGTGWNIFQKQVSNTSVYGQVLQASKNLDKEDFKIIRRDLDDYFDSHPAFYADFNNLTRVYEKDIREAHSRMREAAIAVGKAFAAADLDINKYAGQHLAGRVTLWSEVWEWDYYDKRRLSINIPEFTRKGTRNRVFDPRVSNPWLDTAVEDDIERLAVRMYEAFDAWRKEALSEKMHRWRIYSATMPYVGLLQSVRGNSKLFLTDSNTVELGETNSILSRIIGDDDAPFIYERLGGRLEHFLIDEFQDTSRLQWNNLYPLLAESEGKGNDNLIIGDAKQSIYRFRNADPSLITEKVPEQFASSCHECGNSHEENTNWRSTKRVVRFNNLFFRFFTSELSPEMGSLYSNTVQPPHHTEDAGYVKVQLFRSGSKEEGEEMPAHFAQIPVLIEDMLRRGYSMRDIAVLVDTKEQGSFIIESIMAHNRQPDAEFRIDFISADSLKIGESPAVHAIVSILEAINNGAKAQLRPKEEWHTKGVGDWSKLKAAFSFFAQQHPDLPLSELMSRFLKGSYNPDAIQDMIAGMSTTVLPALVENIMRHFISERMRRSEAPYLAAFQDCVLEFSEGYTSDVTSFLAWWNGKGRHRSISSPEDADAVQIMTVHKSKGLEFRCVIVPYSKQTVVPTNQREWLWVTPDLHEADGLPKIPWIPVWSSPALANTVHADVYEDYLKKFCTDKVNMAYVAYTRAIDELYIYTPFTANKDGSPKLDSGKIGDYLWRLATEADSIIRDVASAHPDDTPYIPSPEEFCIDEESLSWTYGIVPSREEVVRCGVERRKPEKNITSMGIEEYACSRSLPKILYKDPASPDDAMLPEMPEAEPEEEDESIRLYGELMHGIMQYVNTPADVDKALLRAKTRGLLSFDEVGKYRGIILDAMESVRDYGWFNPGLKVLNERAVAAYGKLLRPDRVVLHDDGSATIVDYKFGHHRNDVSYSRQVRRYAKALINAGLANKCESYIWYVTLGPVVKV